MPEARLSSRWTRRHPARTPLSVKRPVGAGCLIVAAKVRAAGRTDAALSRLALGRLGKGTVPAVSDAGLLSCGTALSGCFATVFASAAAGFSSAAAGLSAVMGFTAGFGFCFSPVSVVRLAAFCRSTNSLH